MKKILSIIIVGLFILMGSAVSIQKESAVSAKSYYAKNAPFTTGNANNSPPSMPVIQGQTKGKHDVMYNFNFSSTDPDGDNVYYWIEWGDCPSVRWIGPFPSGQVITRNHTFPRGTWTVQCKAKDIYNATSDWGTLKVTMPLSNDLPSMGFLERLLAWFPNAFPIVRYLLGL